MTKKIIIGLISLLIVGVLLTGMAFFMENGESEITGSTVKSERELDEFRDIVVDVIAADIQIQSGDTFSISYQLHHKEKVERCEVINGTLYFTTKIDMGFEKNWKFGDEQHTVCITVPDKTNLNDLNLSTISGDIAMVDREMHRASLHSTSGNILLTGVTAEQVACEVVSGDIAIAESEMVESQASGKSADISFDGSFAYVDMNTVSGDCSLISDTVQNIKIKNISGGIGVVTPVSGISAKSYGEITYNGVNQGYQFNLPNDNTMLTLISTSGAIDIQTNGNA